MLDYLTHTEHVCTAVPLEKCIHLQGGNDTPRLTFPFSMQKKARHGGHEFAGCSSRGEEHGAVAPPRDGERRQSRDDVQTKYCIRTPANVVRNDRRRSFKRTHVCGGTHRRVLDVGTRSPICNVPPWNSIHFDRAHSQRCRLLTVQEHQKMAPSAIREDEYFSLSVRFRPVASMSRRP